MRVTIGNLQNVVNDNNVLEISPSGWREFCDTVGLWRLSDLPCRVDAATLRFVTAARQRRAATNYGRPAGFVDLDTEVSDEVPANVDPHLATLDWLERWVRWAIDNCEVPVLSDL